MSDIVIKVENLGKKYSIRHEQRERYTALRDVIAHGAKRMGRKGLSPLTPTTQEDFWALKDVSFEVKRGDRVEITGQPLLRPENA